MEEEFDIEAELQQLRRMEKHTEEVILAVIHRCERAEARAAEL
jgi:hypothetical protein